MREVFFEHIALRDCAKCTAIDSETAVEVAVMGPAQINPRDLEKLALAKLRRRLG